MPFQMVLRLGLTYVNLRRIRSCTGKSRLPFQVQQGLENSPRLSMRFGVHPTKTSVALATGVFGHCHSHSLSSTFQTRPQAIASSSGLPTKFWRSGPRLAWAVRTEPAAMEETAAQLDQFLQIPTASKAWFLSGSAPAVTVSKFLTCILAAYRHQLTCCLLMPSYPTSYYSGHIHDANVNTSCCASLMKRRSTEPDDKVFAGQSRIVFNK